MKILYLIPARGGSKGIPKKNIKPLNGKPLIYYTIDTARSLTSDENICLSTDSEEIIDISQKYGLKVPFTRPKKFAADKTGTREVILHAIDFYRKTGTNYDCIVLLQPTSPFRKKNDVEKAVALFSKSTDMVVSVRKAKSNPYYNMFKESTEGYLKKLLDGNYTRRQDCPEVFEFNGNIYVINTDVLIKTPFYKFQKIKKYVMDDISSVDLDNMLDWFVAETILKKGLFTYD